jgi:dephospho-CoA kinase
MLVIGLTGGVASGKTTVSEVLREEGAILIDADQIARGLVQPKTAAWQELVRAFGNEILERDGSIHRQKLASLIFSNPRQRSVLNRILHPRIRKEIRRRLKGIEQKNPEAIVVIDAPLLIETGGHREMDKVIVVACTETQQVERLRRRNQLSEEQARAMLSSQMSLEEKKRVADYVICNDGSPEATRRKARDIFKELKGIALQAKGDTA